MLELSIKVLLAYLLGSLSGSLILGRLRQVDIRQQGSGNAGGTNALRTQGIWFGLGVLIIDIGKGFLAVVFISVQDFGFQQQIGESWLVIACATAVVIGHIWPVFFGFRGGKGVATLLGAMLAVQPLALLPAVTIWILIFLTSGYVGLASMMAVLAFWPSAIYLASASSIDALFFFGMFASALVIFTHRGNIARMYRREEHRVSIFRKSTK